MGPPGPLGPLEGALPAEHFLMSLHEVWPVIPFVVLPDPHEIHFWHEDSYVSAGQALQVAEPEPLMLPGEQALQAVPSEEKVPALHGLQTPLTGAEPASHFLIEQEV